MKKSKNVPQITMPKTIQIDSVTYDIEMSDNSLVLDGQECLGTIDYNCGVISLNSEKIGYRVLPKILMHEIMHGIITERGITLKGDEEKIIDELAIGVINLIRQNPKLINFIKDSSF